VRSEAEVSKYASERGEVERFSLCQRGRELLVFVEVGGEILEVKERPAFQQALVAFLREQGVPIEDLRRLAWQVLGNIWYRPRLLWRFLRNQPPPDDFGETRAREANIDKSNAKSTGRPRRSFSVVHLPVFIQLRRVCMRHSAGCTPVFAGALCRFDSDSRLQVLMVLYQ